MPNQGTAPRQLASPHVEASRFQSATVSSLTIAMAANPICSSWMESAGMVRRRWRAAAPHELACSPTIGADLQPFTGAMAMSTKPGSIELIIAGVALFTTRVYAAQDGTVCRYGSSVPRPKRSDCSPISSSWQLASADATSARLNSHNSKSERDERVSQWLRGASNASDRRAVSFCALISYRTVITKADNRYGG